MPAADAYWLLTAPLGGSGPHEIHSQVTHNLLVSPAGLAPADISQPISFPPLRVGTLASLITLSESLPKSDAAAHSTLNKIRETLGSLVNNDSNALEQHLLVKEASIADYVLGGWSWNAAKYSVEKELAEVVAMLERDVSSIDSVMKTKLQDYNIAKGQLQQLQRKKTGNLSVRSLADVVHKDDFVSRDSEFLQTLLIAVPKDSIKEWQSKYERLTSLVVPRSSSKLAQDDEFALFNVTVFKKVRDEFVQKVRENKFCFREFEYTDELLVKSRQELENSTVSEKELWTELLRLSRTNLSECYQAVVHLRVVRSFVESVLRYGLPADYYATFIKVWHVCGEKYGPATQEKATDLTDAHIFPLRLDLLPSSLPQPNFKKVRALTMTLSTYFNSLEGRTIADKRKMQSHGKDTRGDTEVPGEYASLLEEEELPFVAVEVPQVRA